MSYNPYATRKVGAVPGPSWKPRPKSYRVTFIMNGQERFLGFWAGFSKENALERCRKELKAVNDFKLIATEDKP